MNTYRHGSAGTGAAAGIGCETAESTSLTHIPVLTARQAAPGALVEGTSHDHGE